MALETTTAAGYDRLINTEFLDPMIADALRDPVVATPAVRLLDLSGKGTKTGTFNRRTKDSAVAITELGTPANAILNTDAVQVTGAKFGIRRTFSEEIMNVSIHSEAQILSDQAQDAGLSLVEKIESDICALLPSLTSAVSHSLLAMSYQYHLEAMAKMRTNKCPGSPSQWFALYDDQAAADLEASCASAGAAVFGQSGTQGILGGGDGAGAMGPLFKVPCYSTNLTTVAAGDGVSAMMVDARNHPKHAPIGLVVLWWPKTMAAVDLELVAHGYVHHMATGAGIIHPSTGTKITVRG